MAAILPSCRLRAICPLCPFDELNVLDLLESPDQSRSRHIAFLFYALVHLCPLLLLGLVLAALAPVVWMLLLLAVFAVAEVKDQNS